MKRWIAWILALLLLCSFCGCEKLERVSIPENVEFIGNNVFTDCTSLKEVTFLGNKKNIRICAWAFSNCTSLTSITLSAGLNDEFTDINDEFECLAFEGCTNLKYINISSDSKKYCSVDGVLYTKDMTELVAVPPGRTGEYRIPDNVTRIRSNAFCTSSLEYVVIPEGIDEIPYATFEGSSKLRRIDIPEGVTKIEYNAFRDCTNLSSITIPSSVTDIDSGVFAGCTSLTSITVSPENKKYTSVDGVLFSKDMSDLIMFPCGYTGNYAIPETVKTIEDDAFNGCKGLTSITIPNSVTKAEGSVFEGCIGLKEVVIPGSIGKIYSTFRNCANLETVIIRNGINKIGYSSFENCTNLTSVKIPNSVLEIDDHAFCGCEKLADIELPKNLREIGDDAFSSCKQLKEIVIPHKVTYIGDCAFAGCEKIESVFMPDEASYVGFDAFSQCPITSIIIPKGITEIPVGLFRDCLKLTTATIPDTVTSISGSAFQGCIGLKNINYEGTRSQWNKIKIADYNEPLHFAKMHFDYERPVKENVSIDVHFSQKAKYTNGQFSDVEAGSWFEESVRNAYEFGLMKGKSNTAFDPNGCVTVAEIVAVAARIHRIYMEGNEVFQPVGNNWYQTYFDYAYENDIITAKFYTGDATANATRSQCAEIFANTLPDDALSQINKVPDGLIPDVNMENLYSESIYKLYRAGILTGNSNYDFEPNSYITRAEISAIITRMADTDKRLSFTMK